jgi:hypothetical protein
MLLGPAGAQPVPVAPGSAKVKGQIIAARVQGQVTAISKPSLDRRVLNEGDQVSEQTTIVTAPGASVVLVFSNGATVDIGGDSRLNINEFIQDPFSTDLKASDIKQEPGTSVTKLSLTKGELVGRVAHLNVDRGSEFTIQTPVGAAGIRGTVFRIILRPTKDHKAHFSIETSEGLIVFTGLSTGPLDIPAGHKYEATFDYNPNDLDDPADWLPPDTLTLEGMFISPLEAAQIQSELQTILAAFENVIFHAQQSINGGANGGANGGINGGANGGANGGVNGGTDGGVNGGVNGADSGVGDPNGPPPPAPPLNAPTPGAGSGP